MAIPNITEEYIIQAFSYIDNHGIPDKNKSTRYELVTDDNKRYPPKYVIAVADHLENGVEITTEGYNAVEAKNFLNNKGFTIETKQEKFELIITANNITSTDTRFDINNLGLGNNYKPLDTYLKKADGAIVRRNYNKGERKNSNQTLPRIAFQVFENQISALSVAEKENFPTCRYSLKGDLYCGIFSSVAEFRAYRNTIEYMIYEYNKGHQFVIYCWNIFSTLLFVQECLKRFGDEGDCFVLVYREKEGEEIETESQEELEIKEDAQQVSNYRNPYSQAIIESKNVIFRGAPGTGKSYLAREIAADIISEGYFDKYNMLSDEQKQQVEFVQFHPSYDYSDFVEGLRPKLNADGSLGFELQDGIFKRFVDRARKNYENAHKSKEVFEKEVSAQDVLKDFLSDIEIGVDKFHTITGNEFLITGVDEKRIQISIPNNEIVNNLNISMAAIHKMLETDETFEKVKDVTQFFGKTFATQEYSYILALYKAIVPKKQKTKKYSTKQEPLKKYIFIIDEINRGEISKILGELFFAIEPGYRGEAGEVSTQYSNLHANPNEKFYIPKNVYIIGTMNDIDRSVDTFDFAMRRRFRFIEVKADDHLEMLNDLNDEALKNEAIKRMVALNKEIIAVDGLNENYQIGAAYFLKLKTLSFDQLWTDYLQPLLQEYVNGMYNDTAIMHQFAQAYGYGSQNEGYNDEATQD